MIIVDIMQMRGPFHIDADDRYWDDINSEIVG